MFDSEDEKSNQLEKISKLWKKTLEERGLSEDIYNKICIEKYESKKSKSILKKATSKKELDLLVQARAIVDKSIKNVSEKDSNFGEEFIRLSRDIHFLNDTRAKIKLDINNHTGSKIKEIKEYTNY